jgi:hypothetical protein
MDDAIYQEWKQRWEDGWNPEKDGQMRHGSPGQRLAPLFAECLPRNATVNEYGSGTGRAVMALKALRPDLTIHMVDIAENALEPEARQLIGKGVEFILRPLWELGDDFPGCRLGLLHRCIDVRSACEAHGNYVGDPAHLSQPILSGLRLGLHPDGHQFHLRQRRCRMVAE